MSDGFISFSHEIEPLSDSLPQILHFEDKIMDLLVSYLEKKERESIEPMLHLLTDFAHDLGTRFEKHYGRALKVVTSIAGTPQDVEVVEWSFTCLAFMFKYLSKLLVSDLRPTYDLMAPLLGRERQQPHIARFAAEAMSFLIKKAGAPAVREKALKSIVQHAKIDLINSKAGRQYTLYYHGIMTMFAEAMKGNGLTIHSSGVAIIECLFSQLNEGDVKDSDESVWADVICGVLTSMVHHTSSDTLKELIASILEISRTALESFQMESSSLNFFRVLLSVRAIGIITGVRKGSRVGNWPDILASLSRILQALSKAVTATSDYRDDPRLWQWVMLSVSIALQYSPMDCLIPFVAPFLDALSKDPFAKWFLTFCSYFAKVDTERFHSTVLPYFQRYEF
jgi:U3 small nucleolar RNA-associated protein 20